MRKLILSEFKRSGLSIKALSDKSGVGYQSVYSLVKGDRDPQLSTIERLSRVLGLELRRKASQKGGK